MTISHLPYKDISLEKLAITQKDRDVWKKAFEENRASRVAKNATTSVGIKHAARVPEAIQRAPFAFTIDLKQGKRCNQEHSGRCWLFASLNVIRQRFIEQYNLKTFEFSQNYAMFYDKLEKCNLFLLHMIDTVDEPIEGRLMAYLLDQPMDDGGQWDMFCNIVRKYGVVPKEAMPETACSRDTTEMDRLLTRYLRSCCMEIRKKAEAGVGTEALMDMREEMVHNVYTLLVTCLGEPPCSFNVTLRNKDDELICDKEFTPKTFTEELVDFDLDAFVSCIHAPSADKPMHTLFEVDRLGNVCEDGYVRHYNLPIEEIKKAVIAQLKDGFPVWFGVDMGQATNRDEAWMIKEAFALDDLFGFSLEHALDKGSELTYYESAMTHAMVIEGVKLDEKGKPLYWKVENSWGKDHGPNDGFEIMSDAWFDSYVFQVVLKKMYLAQEDQEKIAHDSPVVLPPWDPMGKLA